MNVSPKKAMLLMALCAFLWSIGGLLVKLLPWHPLVICGLRSLIAAVIILLYMRLRKHRFTVSRCAILSGLGLAGTMLLFCAASKLTTSANAIILQSTNPIHIMVLNTLLYHHRYRKGELVAVGITLAGISLFFLDQLSPGNLLGNGIALCSGFTMAVMYLFGSRLPDEASSMSSVLIGHGTAAAVGLVCALFAPPAMGAANLAAILTLGVVQLGVPYVLYAIAVRNCSPLSCSLIGMIEPLLNPVWVFLVIGERPGAFALLGAAVVMVTVCVWSVLSARAPAPAGADVENSTSAA